MQLVVLGMHRSGTSAVAGMLNMMGAYFGPEGIDTGAGPENPKGFWERRDIRQINDEVLQSAGADWHLVADFETDDIPAQAEQEYVTRVRNILLDLDANRPWVIKEPRLCLLFPLWRDLLEAPVCVHVYRSPIQTAQSLQKRNGFAIQFGLALWEKYNLRALESSSGLPRVLVTHEELMGNPTTTIRSLYDDMVKLGVEGLRLPNDDEILSFIDPRLFREKGDSTLQNGYINHSQLRLNEMFKKKGVFEVETLPPLSEGSIEAMHTFQQRLRDEHEVEKLSQELSEAVLEKDRLLSELDHRSQEIHKLSRWIDELEVGVSALLKTSRWRIGHAIGELSRRAMFKPRVPMASDHINRLVNEFHAWKGGLRYSKRQAAEKTSDVYSKHVSHIPAITDMQKRRVTIIVPIFNSYEEVKVCIENLVRNTTYPHSLLLIDDCSSDKRIWPLIQAYENTHQHVRSVRNATNMGYTATINKGCVLSRSDDVVLLNSDTQVTRGWLKRLAECARREDEVATVTPLSNAAGAFSVPINNSVNELPSYLSVDEMGRLVERLSKKLRPKCPTGNGFCMYVTRAALNEVGCFDAVSFPRGYGEENDFCMRATAKGFIHLIDDATFIYHKRTASFKTSKDQIVVESKVMLQKLHPEYKRIITKWLENDELKDFRRELAKAIETLNPSPLPKSSIERNRPAILYVVHNGSGGTIETSKHLIRGVSKKYRCLLLMTDLDRWFLHEYREKRFKCLRDFVFNDTWHIAAKLGRERLSALREICLGYQVRLVHVRHLLSNSPEIIMELKAMCVPVVFSFHDFYTICPTIHLIDDQGTYCSGYCTPGEGKCNVSRTWLNDIPPLKHRFVYEWRERTSQFLRLCDAYVTTSKASRHLLIDHFSFLEGPWFTVIEHGRDFSAYRPVVAAPSSFGPVRVVVFGALGLNKGIRLIENIMRIAAEDGSRFEFHILGHKHKSFDPAALGGVYHGPYELNNLPDHLKKIRPSFALIPSVWSETFCHTLTEAWASGLPVFASNIGALKERIEENGGGWLLDYTDPEAWYEAMLRVLNDQSEYKGRLDEVGAMKHKGISEMGDDYSKIYARLLRGKDYTATADRCSSV